MTAVRRSLRLMSSVYLCGPITGLTPSEATGWRRTVAEALAGKAEVIDPMRGAVDRTRRCSSEETREMSLQRRLHGKRTVARDRRDVQRSSVVLACFLGAKTASIGAVGEIFWADAMGKPVVVVREKENLHNHDMLNEIASWIFEDLGRAIEHVKTLL